MVTAQEIVNEFAVEVNRAVARVQAEPEAGLDALVALTLGMIRRFGRLILTLLAQEAEEHQRRPLCPQCGQPMRRHGWRSRAVVSVVGEANLPLRRFRCAACSQEASPGAARSRLRRGCTTELWTLALELAAAMPYRPVEDVFKRLGIYVSDNTVEDLVREIGGELAARQRQETVAIHQHRLTLRAAQRPQRLYLMVDGRSVKVDGQWRELKVGTIFETAAAEPDALGRWPQVERVSSFAMVGGVEEFIRRFYTECQRRGILDAVEVVIVADGAPWIWNWLPGLVPVGCKLVQLLDFWHASGHVREAVEAAFRGEPGKAKFWGDHLSGLLQAGELPQVMTDLRRLRNQTPEGERRQTVQRQLQYLERHRERLHYFQRHWEGYYIGSGHVESLCKRFGLRVKGCGMNWSAAGLEAIVAVYNHVHSYPHRPLSLAA